MELGGLGPPTPCLQSMAKMSSTVHLTPPAPGMPVVMLFAAEGGRAMLVELSVAEQCYHAVMEVIVAPVIEVAGSVTPRPHRRWRAFSCFALR